MAAGYVQVPNPAADSYPLKAPASLYRPVLWHWNGHEWGSESSGAKGSVGLVGTGCASSSNCWAVGAQFVGKLGNQLVGVIVHNDGHSWSASVSPSPAGAAFNGVACTSASHCLVVGTRQTSAAAAHALAESWNGAAWSDMAVPSPHGALWSVLDSLTCYDATYCLALGSADNSTKGPGYFFAEKFDGSTWSLVPDKDPGQFNMGNESGMFQISCPSEDDCLAVGSSLFYTHGQEGADFPSGVAQHWDGTSWSPVKTPLVDDGYLVLNGVSCISGVDCWVAMGFPGILGLLDHYIPIAHWDGSTFTVSTLKTKGFLAGISCLSENVGTWCIGLGEAPVGSTGKGMMTGGDFLQVATGRLRATSRLEAG